MRFPVILVSTLLLALCLAPPVFAQLVGQDPAPEPKVAQLEVSFMTGMIPHHRQVIEMSQIALTKATRPELREMAQQIIQTQQEEIYKMSAFLRDWYGVEPPSGSSMPQDVLMRFDMPIMQGLMPDMSARMRALEVKTGADFDIEYMSATVDHHALAIMMASPVLIAGHHEDLYTLAEEIVISQGEEIKRMDEWLNQWYGVKRPLP